MSETKELNAAKQEFDPHLLALKMWQIVGMLLVIMFAAVWRGWFLSILWGWFAVPIFALPALSIVQGVGIMVVVAFITPLKTPTAEEIKNQPSTPKRLAFMVFSSSAILGYGWLVHTWMVWQ